MKVFKRRFQGRPKESSHVSFVEGCSQVGSGASLNLYFPPFTGRERIQQIKPPLYAKTGRTGMRPPKTSFQNSDPLQTPLAAIYLERQ